MSFLLLSSFLLCCVVCTHPLPASDLSSPWPGAAPLECLYNGRFYFEGDTTNDPCNPCTCTNPDPGNYYITVGKMVCTSVSCFGQLPCVDAVKVKGKCCPICPSGPNCKHGNRIINVGEVYKPDPDTICTCRTGMASFGSQGHEASCTKI